MKQKTIKYHSELFKQDVLVTIDENLTALQGKVLAPKKLEAANKSLRKLKNGIPK